MKPTFSILRYVNIRRTGVDCAVGANGDKPAAASLPVPAGLIRQNAMLPMLLSCMFLPSSLCYGTSIVATWSKYQVAIAADSKVRRFENTGVEIEGTSSCKIRKYGGVFFAASGLTRNTSTGFDVYHIAEGVVRQGGTISAMGMKFENAVGDKLALEVNSIRRYDPKRYNDIKDSDILDFVFAGLENRIPGLTVGGFSHSLNVRGTVQVSANINSCPSEECGNEPIIFFMGAQEAAKAYENMHPDFWVQDFVAGVRKWIEIEIADKPETVGPPIDILRITTDGAQWIQQKPECEETKKSPPTKPAPKPPTRHRPRR